MVGIAVTVYTVDANCRIPLVSETFGRASMSDLDDLIAAAKQGYLQRVNAILEADNSLVNQKGRVRRHARTLCGAERP